MSPTPPTDHQKPARGWASAYARHAGVDRSFVSRLIRGQAIKGKFLPHPKEGEEFDLQESFLQADTWRTANQREGVGHKSKTPPSGKVGGFGLSLGDKKGGGLRVAGEVNVDDLATVLVRRLQNLADDDMAERERGDGVEATLRRLQAAERRTFRALTCAQMLTQARLDDFPELRPEQLSGLQVSAAGILPGLRRLHTDQASVVARYEARADDIRTQRGILAPSDEIWPRVQRLLEVALTAGRNIPTQGGHRANPENPRLAETELSKLIEETFVPVLQAALEESLAQ